MPARRQRLTVDDFRRLAKACRDLDDPVVMATAWGDQHEGVRVADSMHETAPTMKHPRSFGQLPSLTAPDAIDDPLPDTEIGMWKGNSPS